MKLLVVDDSKVARMFIRSIINEYSKDIEIVEAENGREGIALYKKETPDLTLLDLTMPVMDGFEALKEMKGIDADKPVYVITADIQKKALDQCLALGAEGVLKKLPKKEELFEILGDIEKRRGRDR